MSYLQFWRDHLPGQPKQLGSELIAECPTCGRPKLYANVATGLWQCWRCGLEMQGNAFTYLRRFGGARDNEQAFDLLKRYGLSKSAGGMPSLDMVQQVACLPPDDEERLRKAHERLLAATDCPGDPQSADALTILEASTFTMDIVHRFKLGWGKTEVWNGQESMGIIIPYFDERRRLVSLWNYRPGRVFRHDGRGAKMLPCRKGMARPLPFNIAELAEAPPDRPCVICEGPKDTMHAASALGDDYVAIGKANNAQWDAAWGPAWFAHRRAYLVPDRDEADKNGERPGLKGAQATAESLTGVGIEAYLCELPPALGDAGADLTDLLARHDWNPQPLRDVLAEGKRWLSAVEQIEAQITAEGTTYRQAPEIVEHIAHHCQGANTIHRGRLLSLLAKALKPEGCAKADLNEMLEAKLRRLRGEDGQDESEIVQHVSRYATPDRLYEQYMDSQGTGFLEFNRATGQVKKVFTFEHDGRQFEPHRDPRSASFDPCKLLRNGNIRLPSDAEGYQSDESLLADLRDFIWRHVQLHDDFYDLCAYYALFTWCYDSHTVVPYLRFHALPGTGKSRALNVMHEICYMGVALSGCTSPAALFRTIDMFPGTMVIDEADIGRQDVGADLRTILRLGFEASGTVVRCEVESNQLQPEPYSVFSPKILAGVELTNDSALESRIITETMPNLSRDDIPRHLDTTAFGIEGLALRNRLMLWRFHNYQRRSVNPDAYIASVTARTNQIIAPLATVVPAGKRRSFRRYVTRFQQATAENESDSLDAVVMFRIWSHYTDKGKLLTQQKLWLEDLLEVVKEDTGLDGLSSRGLGHILTKLGFERKRSNNHRYVMWNPDGVDQYRANMTRLGLMQSEAGAADEATTEGEAGLSDSSDSSEDS